MKGMYAIYDEVIETFNQPFLCENDAVATRSFYDGLRTIDSIKLHKDDLKLFKVGDFDEVSGKITSDLNMITQGKSFIINEKGEENA